MTKRLARRRGEGLRLEPVADSASGMKSDSLGKISPEMIVSKRPHAFGPSLRQKSPRDWKILRSPGRCIRVRRQKTEPGRLTVIRRKREYFNSQARFHHSLGTIDVRSLRRGAIAGYAFRVEAKNMAGSLGTLKDERISQGRATQVFMFGHDGILRIIHEHFSAAMLATLDEYGKVKSFVTDLAKACPLAAQFIPEAYLMGDFE